MGKLTEKRDPIPAGVYWVDIIDRNLADPVNLAGFNRWAMDVAPRVKILKKDREVTGDFFDMPRGQRVWTLFRVTKPVPRWPKSVAIGFPTRARKGAEMKPTDTTQRKPPQGVADYWSDKAGDALSSRWGGVAIAFGLLWLVGQQRR